MPGVHRGQSFLFAGLAIFAGALLGLWATGHETVGASRDSGAGTSIWAGTLAVGAAMVLIRLIPWRAPALALPEPGAGARKELITLVSIALGFPLLGFAFALSGVDKRDVTDLVAVAKPVVFLLLPWLLLRKSGRLLIAPAGESVWRPQGWWRWLAPVPALLVFGYFQLFGPLAGPLPRASDHPDLTVLIITAVYTVLTANVLEELFYRVMLQTRLEQRLGRWPGIVTASLLFALMHLPGHAQGTSVLASLPLTLGAIVVVQGVFALFTGYLWARYRNVWVIIAAHTITNTLPLFFMT